MVLSVWMILILGLTQGLAELLPVSSSAHVIVVEKLLGLDPTTPQMTFLLVMLHTGTMFAVLIYFWKRWVSLLKVWRELFFASLATAIVGFGLKKLVEKTLLLGISKGEIENLFGNLPLIATALACAGVIILFGAKKDKLIQTKKDINKNSSFWIGMIQGLCIPFRGFSRSGATISTGLILGLRRQFSEEFSFALAVILTPAAIALELHRLIKNHTYFSLDLVKPGLIGMVFSFFGGLIALKWLSKWLETGNWVLFGYYCFFFAGVVLAVHHFY